MKKTINLSVIGVFTGKLVKELISELPLSLFTKLSDGRLSQTETLDLAREITSIVIRVVMETNDKAQEMQDTTIVDG